MPLPVEKVASWEPTGLVHWYGRCDGCGKRQFLFRLYDCYPEEGTTFFWQCAPCMVLTLSEKGWPEND